MAKRDYLQKQYTPKLEENIVVEPVVEEKPAIVIEETPKYNKGISNTILVRSKVDAIYKTTGVVSGRMYVFSGAGAIVNVDKRDVDELLSRRKRVGCCGGSTPTTIFELLV